MMMERVGMIMRPVALVAVLFALPPGLLGCATRGGPFEVEDYFISPELSRLDGAVAVLPFRNLSGNSSATFEVTDRANLALGETGLFTLVERIRVQELYDEQDFDPDRVDESTAVEIGRMLGAHAVVLGTITDYRRGRVGISMRLVSVETGRHLWQARDTADYNDRRVRGTAETRSELSELRRRPEALAEILIEALAATLGNSVS